MTGLNTSIGITDNMTRPLLNIINSMDMVVSSMRNIEGVNLNSLNIAQQGLNKGAIELNHQMDKIETNINENATAMGKFNTKVTDSNNSTNKLISSIKKMGVALGGVMAVKKTISLADNVMTTNARLKLINDGEIDDEEFKKQIYEMSQRSRGDYSLNVDAVAKLGMLAGDAFDNNTEIVNFQEVLNKQMSLSGATGVEKQSATLQLTQAMASGKLQGDEYRSLRESNPMLIESIAKTMNVTKGQLREMSSEGLITADVIKTAVLNSAEDINAKFNTLPKTFGQIGMQIKNTFIKNFEPVALELSKIVNSDNFMMSVNLMSTALIGLIGIMTRAIKIGSTIGSVIANNLDIIIPTLAIVTSLWAAYTIAVNLARIAEKKNAIIMSIGNGLVAIKNSFLLVGAGLMSLFTGATMAQTVSQMGLNKALYSCPIVWIIAGIVALVGVIFLVVAVINKFAGTSISAFGLIVGGVATLVSSIIEGFKFMVNVVLTHFNFMYNGIALMVETLVNLFANPISTIARLFFDLTSEILNMFSTVSKVIDRIFGTDYSILLGSVAEDLQKWSDDKFGEKGFKVERDALKKYLLDINNPMDAGRAGYEWGSKFYVGNKFAEDVRILEELKKIEGNTGESTRSIDLTREELKYMRDIAEREVINKYTTASVKLDVKNNNNINSNLDVDTVIGRIVEGMKDGVSTVAEGRY